MTQTTDRINEAFAAHEHLAPDELIVLARAREIARGMQRRRWVVRATSVSVVGAGLVAGGIALPGVVHRNGANSTVGLSPLAGGASSPAPTHTQTQEIDAYVAAGYGYNDAVQLAALWHETDIAQVKAEAGEKLLDGESLPVQPTAAAELAQEQDVEAFFNAGYEYNDAVQLGALWHETDISKVKAEAGQKLRNGATLPVKPSGVSASKETLALQAFFNAGYDYNDAVRLGRMWHKTDTSQVKVEAGQKLLNGETLPIAP